MNPNEVITVNTIHGTKKLLVKGKDIISVKGGILKYRLNGIAVSTFISLNEQRRLKKIIDSIKKPSILERIKKFFFN